MIAVRGRGRNVLGDQAQDMQSLDTVYIAPWTPHQIPAAGEEPLGFFCIVDADRDRPLPGSSDEYDQALGAGAAPGK